MKSGSCRLCENKSLRTFGSFDLRVSNETSSVGECQHSLLVECARCGIVFKDDLRSEDMISEYQETYYAADVILEEHVKYLYALRWLKVNGSFAGNSKVLDFGCGKGYFLHQLRTAGLVDIHGVELNQSALACLKRQGFDVSNQMSGLASPGPYDVITLFHVLEHLEDPKGFLVSLKDSLSENGEVVIEVPNIDSYGFRRYGSEWFYLQQEHLYYFNEHSLVSLLENAGYKIEKLYRFGGFFVTKGSPGRKKMLGLSPGLKKILIRCYLWGCDLFGLHDFIGVIARK